MHNKIALDIEPGNEMMDELFRKTRNNTAITFNQRFVSINKKYI